MKKLIILIGTLLISQYCFADINTTQVNSAIQHSLYVSSHTQQKPIIYGGKDIFEAETTIPNGRAVPEAHLLG